MIYKYILNSRNKLDYEWYKSIFEKLQDRDIEENNLCLHAVLYSLFEHILQNDIQSDRYKLFDFYYTTKFTDETQEINISWTRYYHDGTFKILRCHSL